MATLATYFRRNGTVAVGDIAMRAASDPFRLRNLPADHLFMYSKSVDNSRLVRQADPAARGECWSALAAAAVLLLVVGSIVAPQVASVLAGYQVESLKAEYKTLVDQKRDLETKEAGLLSPERLNDLAKANSLVNPDTDQVFHLENQAPGSFAKVDAPKMVDSAAKTVPPAETGQARSQ